MDNNQPIQNIESRPVSVSPPGIKQTFKEHIVDFDRFDQRKTHGRGCFCRQGNVRSPRRLFRIPAMVRILQKIEERKRNKQRPQHQPKWLC